MAGGYNSPPQGELGWLADEFKKIWTRLSELETPTGTSVNSLVAQVQATLANINATAAAAASAWMAANGYTKSQTDAKIANPPAGSAVTGNVSATGNLSGVDVNASGRIFTPHGLVNPVTFSWTAAAINGDGRVAVQPSSLRFKDDVVDYDGTIVDHLRPVTFVMKEDPSRTRHIGFIAEAVNDVEPMAVVHVDGEPFALKQDAILAAVVRDIQRITARITILERAIGNPLTKG